MELFRILWVRLCSLKQCVVLRLKQRVSCELYSEDVVDILYLYDKYGHVIASRKYLLII